MLTLEKLVWYVWFFIRGYSLIIISNYELAMAPRIWLQPVTGGGESELVENKTFFY